MASKKPKPKQSETPDAEASVAAAPQTETPRDGPTSPEAGNGEQDRPGDGPAKDPKAEAPPEQEKVELSPREAYRARCQERHDQLAGKLSEFSQILTSAKEEHARCFTEYSTLRSILAPEAHTHKDDQEARMQVIRMSAKKRKERMEAHKAVVGAIKAEQAAPAQSPIDKAMGNRKPARGAQRPVMPFVRPQG